MSNRIPPSHVRLTYADFCALPDDGKRYEIIDGDLYMSPSPKTPHQRAVANLHLVLGAHVKRAAIGAVFIAPFDVVLDDENVVEPDLIFVSTARRGIVGPDNIRGVPDLHVEVLSPLSARRDLTAKKNLYERAGVNFYWILDTERRTLTELALVNGKYEGHEHGGDVVVKSALFPDLQINLAELFE